MFLFSEIMGHEEIKEHLQMAIRGDMPFHAYIFHGEVGCGKETMARTFAAGLQCTSEGFERPCGVCASCKHKFLVLYRSLQNSICRVVTWF